MRLSTFLKDPNTSNHFPVLSPEEVGALVVFYVIAFVRVSVWHHPSVSVTPPSVSVTPPGVCVTLLMNRRKETPEDLPQENCAYRASQWFACT